MGSVSDNNTTLGSRGMSTFKKLAQNKWLRITILLIVLGFAVYFIQKQSSTLVNIIGEHEIKPGPLIISTTFILISVLLGVVLWWLIMAGFGYKLPGLETARIHILTTLAKYIPGLIWQFSGKTYLSNEMGIPTMIAGLGIGLEVGISLLSGIGITLLLSPTHLFTRFGFPKWGIQGFKILGSVLLIVVILSPIVWAKLFRKQIGNKSEEARLKYWFYAVFVILTGWGLLGSSFFLASKAFSFSGLGLIDSLFVVSAAYVGGILVIIVPNGLVVREVLLTALLPQAFDSYAALLLSLVARVQVIASELLVGVVVGVTCFCKKRRQIK